VAVAALGGSLDGPETTLEFVRFCRDRRRVAWPEIYDEMCAVARRRLFRGWGFDELADHGVGFGLFHLPALADTTRRVLLEEEAAARCREADHATVTPAA
jgi:hypothetical protein